MGDRDYAAEMAAFLDPEGLYFKGRTISKVHAVCSSAWVPSVDNLAGSKHGCGYTAGISLMRQTTVCGSPE